MQLNIPIPQQKPSVLAKKSLKMKCIYLDFLINYILIYEISEIRVPFL